MSEDEWVCLLSARDRKAVAEASLVLTAVAVDNIVDREEERWCLFVRPDAVAFTNEFAPEHLQIAASTPWDLAGQVTNAGEILLGQDAPFSMANFMIGVNAVLPTGGKACSASALGVMDYMKRISVAHLTREGYDGLADETEAFARYEGFDAHALAISARNRNEP